MNNLIANLLFIAILSTPIFGQKADLAEVEFLIGTWKTEDKESFEKWSKQDTKFIGKSFKLINGQERVSETLEIKRQGEYLVYTATVFDQNDAKGIPFILKSTEDKKYSFENPNHDFPKKIQYKIVNPNKLLISVLGAGDKGFSFYLNRQ
jgi:hypothetical protein